MAPQEPTVHAGLSAAQVERQRALDGPNALPRPPRRGSGRILLEVAREPMFQLLAAAVALYGLVGDFREAAVLLAFLAVIAGITLVQERRTERVLESLRDMTSPRAMVWRDGARQRIAGTQLVRGDLIELAEGDRVPADGRLIEANDLAVDESLISGESLPVAKRAGAARADEVFAGTLVVAGRGLAQVSATGAHSQIGRIGLALGTIEPQVTPLHRQTRQLVRWFSALGLLVSLLAGWLFFWTRGDWLGALLAGIALAMSLLPQEFLLILTVFMAMGAWRLSRRRVLTRRAASIEALGAATVLCTDKTGTLTRNQMAIHALVRFPTHAPASEPPQRWTAGQGPLPDDLRELLRVGVWACEREAFDPMERAFHALAGQWGVEGPADWQLVHEYGLSPQWPMMTHVWRHGDEPVQQVATKGAPESVVRLCRLPASVRERVLAEAAALADRGMRVLGVASATWRGADWPADPQGFDFQWLGLVALADPLRRNVPQAVQALGRAGIRVVMITGDHPGTALAIARQAGIADAAAPLLGRDIEAMDAPALRQRVAATTVFARVNPQQKLRIVQALKAQGEVVAMTGDGVNDAPSLKMADIGIAMGGRGTDVAREAASLVLLDDDFGTLVQAVQLGRRIDDNLRKAMRFVFAVHVPIAGLTLAPLVLGWPLLFTPMHIAFLEILIDPVCSVVFEAQPEEPDVMRRPPRDPAAPLFGPAMMAASLLQGAVVLALVGLFYGGLLWHGPSDPQARAAAFVALIASNFALILINRSRGHGGGAAPNRALWVTVLVTVALLIALLSVPALRQLFGFELPGPATLAGALGVGGAAFCVLWVLRRSRVA